MGSWWLEVLSMAFALFLLMDPVGNVPLFVSLLKDVPVKRQSRIIFRELSIALFIILLFHFVGEGLLRFLHVSTPTVLISGGLILFLIAIKMIFPQHPDASHDPLPKKEPFIVPLAIPLVAGPAVLAAVILYSGNPELHAGITVTAIILAWAVSILILLSASLVKRWLGSRGLVACERLMGLILTLLAVQMFLEGVHAFLN